MPSPFKKAINHTITKTHQKMHEKSKRKPFLTRIVSLNYIQYLKTTDKHFYQLTVDKQGLIVHSLNDLKRVADHDIKLSFTQSS